MNILVLRLFFITIIITKFKGLSSNFFSHELNIVCWMGYWFQDLFIE